MREILKATLQTSGSSVLQLLFRALAMKIYAVVLGPAGVGLFAMLRHLQDLAISIGTLRGDTALVQGLSARQGIDRQRYLATVFRIYLVTTVLVLAILVFLGANLARLVVSDEAPEIAAVAPWLALPVLQGIVLGFVVAVTTAERDYGRVALAHAAGPAVLLLLAFPVAWLVADGHLVVYVLAHAVAIFCAVLVVLRPALRRGWLAPATGAWHGQSARLFARTVAGLYLASLATSVGAVALRALIVRRFGTDGLGVFEAAWQVSAVYFGILLASFRIYHLPVLSAAADDGERRRLLGDLAAFTALLVGPALAALIVFKPWVVELLFSAEFTPGLEVLRWLLPGDFLKAMWWVLMAAILGAGRISAVVTMTVAFEALLLGGSAVLLETVGDTEVVGWSYIAASALYAAVAYAYCHHRFGFSYSRATLVRLAASAVLVIGATVWTWQDEAVRLWPVVGLGLASAAYLVLLPTGAERAAARSLAQGIRRRLGGKGTGEPK